MATESNHWNVTDETRHRHRHSRIAPQRCSAAGSTGPAAHTALRRAAATLGITCCALGVAGPAHGESLMEQLSTLNGIGYVRSVDFTGGNALLSDLIGEEPTSHQEAAAIFRIDSENLFMNARLIASDPTLGAQQTRFNEIGARYAFDNGVTVLAGKRIETLDTSQAFFPLGFFQLRPSTADIYDRYGEVEGVPLAEVKWVGDSYSVEAIAGRNHTLRNDVDDRDVAGNTELVRGGYNWSGGSASLLTGAHAGNAGVGGTISLDVRHSSTVYASAWAQRGSTRPVPRFIENDTTPITADDYANVDRQNDRQVMWRSAVGMQSALPGNFSLIVEWSHDESKFDAHQWQQMVGAINANRALLPFNPGAALLGLDATAQYVSVDGSLRDYFFARLGKKIGRTEVSVRGIYSPQDKGFLAVAQAVTDINKRVSFDLAITHAFAGSGSEYHAVGLSTEIDAAVRVRF